MASKAKRSTTLQGSRERPPLAKGGGAARAPAHTTSSTASSKRVKHKDSVTPAHSRDDSDSFQGDHAAGFSQSAAVSTLKRELTELKQDNTALKKELSDIKALHEQLLHEAPEENFSEKRVNLLKSQIFQLERQVLLMSQSLGTRGELLVDLFNTLEWLEGQTCGEVLQRISTLKLRLSKYTTQSSALDKLSQPVRFLDSFIMPKSRTRAMQGVPDDAMQGTTTLTLVDICRGGALSHVNRKHVSHLETKLTELFGQLVQLKASLETAPSPIGHLLQPIRKQHFDHVTKCCKLIGECCHGLLCLSVLLPTPPQPHSRGSELSSTFSVDDVIRSLPASVRSKREVRDSIGGAVCAFNHAIDMQDEKLKALHSELQFHRDVYSLQSEYIDTLFKGVRSGYEEFEKSLQEIICSPIEVLLNKYDTLSQTASEEALKDFLLCFKQHYPEMRDAIRRIKKAGTLPPSGLKPSTGAEALSHFGQQFFEELYKLERRQLT